jgi:hypothetical protein
MEPANWSDGWPEPSPSVLRGGLQVRREGRTQLLEHGRVEAEGELRLGAEVERLRPEREGVEAGAVGGGMPGTWLAAEDLQTGGEPTGTEADCECHQPRIWDNQRGVWLAFA